ncbi:MAG: DUF6531 domain-containing protein, partial [Burkholderiaceae bacterium]|nr:DUF6531 domain-containing protein [Burkholderiaceae bacterium]MCO5112286.1 DUF6531 domain-containing protein [Burkholderiaceae bacterium]
MLWGIVYNNQSNIFSLHSNLRGFRKLVESSILIYFAALMLLGALMQGSRAHAQSNICVENGGEYECSDPKIVSETRHLCFESGPFMPLMNAAVACGWTQGIDSDQIVAQKAECWYRSGCTAKIDNPEWSQNGQVYNSNFCWNILTEEKNGIAIRSFAVMKGVRTTTPPPSSGNPQPPACSATAAVPQDSIPVVAMRSRELGCDEGWTRYDVADGYECRRRLVIPPKYCESCPNDDIYGAELQDGALIGNPIVTATTEKRQHEVDYLDIGAHPLTLQRVHRSSWATKTDWPLLSEARGSSLGKNWIHNFHASIDISAPRANKNVRAYVTLENGDIHVFYRTKTSAQDNSSEWKTPESGARLKTLLNNSIVSGYIYTHSETDVQWEFDALGRLIRRTEPNGWAMTYIYGLDGKLQQVTNQFGRSLVFFYGHGGKLVRVRTPDQKDIFYDYALALDRVTYQDGTQRRYVYEDARFPLALTGVFDEDGVRYSTYRYDSSGRAFSTELADSVYKHSIEYEPWTGTTRNFHVTDALGTKRSYRTYYFSNSRAGIDYMSTPSAESNDAIFIRNFSNVGLVRETRYFGYWYQNWPTYYEWDALRRLPTRISEGAYSLNTEIAGYVWHPKFRVPVSINEVKRVTDYTYDSSGNPLSETVRDKSSGVVSTRGWTYSADGLINSYTQANGATTRYAYDSSGNLVKVIAPDGSQTIFTNDASGRITSKTSHSGVVTNYEYDLRGRLRRVQTDGQISEITYRPTGLIASIGLPGGHTISYRYDPAHRLIGWSDNRGTVGTYVLDTMGNRLQEQIVGAQGVIAWNLSRSINALNRVASETLGGTQLRSFEYDINADLVRVTNGLNETHRVNRDEKRRPYIVYRPDGFGTVSRYDVVNNLLHATDYKGVTTTYQRDAQGNPTQETSPDSGSQTTQYDPLGLPRQVTDALGRSTTYERDLLGRPTHITHADGASTTLQYDQGAVGYLSSITDPSGTTSYERDSLGRTTRKTQTLSNGNTRSIAYQYD